MRLLIFGPGVIGSLYASLFAEAGFDTAVYARGARLETNNSKCIVTMTNSMDDYILFHIR